MTHRPRRRGPVVLASRIRLLVPTLLLAVLVGSCATTSATDRDPARSVPPSAPSAAARLIASPDATLREVDFADRDAAVATWQLCEPASGRCRVAVVATADDWRTRRVLPGIYADDPDSFPDFLAHAVPGGGIYLELTDGSARYVAPDGSTSRLSPSNTPLAPGPGRDLLGAIGLLNVDAAVLDVDTRSVHPLAPAPRHPVRFPIVPDPSGRLWAIADSPKGPTCDVLVSSEGGTTWKVLQTVPCPPGASVSIVALRHSALILTAPAPPSLAAGGSPVQSSSPTSTQAPLLAVSETGAILARASPVLAPDLIGAHLIRAGNSVGLVAVPSGGPSTIAPVDPTTAAVGAARPLGAIDLTNGDAGGVAWTQGSAGDHSVTVYSDNLNSGARISVR